LADRHLDLEIQLDAGPEVLRYLDRRARSRDEVAESHARRMALTGQVEGLGFWMAFGSDGGKRGSPPATEGEGEFIGLIMLPPAHGPDQPDAPPACTSSPNAASSSSRSSPRSSSGGCP
jgi:hypothetical protein